LYAEENCGVLLAFSLPVRDNDNMTLFDETMMRRALELAWRGQGRVEPNPMVGAVVVRDGQLVGEGWHERFGQAHAEANALAQAGSRARGGTLYVTLEPCCHHGKTPPCTDAVLRSGVRRVVAAMLDPNPIVAGRGISRLREAGLEVDTGLCEAEARRLNAPYVKLIQTGRPHVIAKWAMTLDGKIATAAGDSRWITSEAARACVHALRGRVDGVLIGAGTARTDDPLLTARPPGPRVATRIVLDTRLQLRESSRLVRTARDAPLLLVHSLETNPERRRLLQDLGCECLALPCDKGKVELAALLDELGRRRFTNLLVEGGAAVLGSFFDAQAVDEAWVFVAAKLVGGVAAPSPVAGAGRQHLADAILLSDTVMEPVGTDWLFRGQVRYSSV